MVSLGLPGILVVLVLLGNAAGEDAEFCVSPRGDDAAPGTRENPFRTLPRARQAVREAIRSGKGGVRVVLRGGTYELAEPLRFGPEDSTPAGGAVTWEAFPGEIPTLSGGRRIAGWKEVGAGVWSAAVQGSPRRLFVDGRPAVRARTPNAGDPEPCWRLEGAEFGKERQVLRLPAGRARKWRGLPDVEAVVIGDWEAVRKGAGDVDEAGGAVILRPPHVLAHPAIRPRRGLACWFEGSPDFLDEPGEWCLDRGAGAVLYRPRPGEDMGKAEVVATRLPLLVEVAGEPSRPVRNLGFKGLRFAHADWPLPPQGYIGIQACYYQATDFIDDPHHALGGQAVDAAIVWRFAEGCSIADSDVAHVAGVGLHLGKGCVGNRVEGCRFFDAGAGAIRVGEYEPEKHRRGGGYAAPAGEAVRGNRVRNSLVTGCGVDYPGGVGIWIGVAEGTEVAHSELHDLPYTGISVGFVWSPEPTGTKDNIIEANHIHDVMRVLADGGGIYTLGFQPGSRLSGNLIHDVRRGALAVGAPNNGIFMDEGSKGFTLERNVIYATSAGPVRHNKNGKGDHTWVENSLGAAPGSPGFPAETAARAGLEPSFRDPLRARGRW